jgi:hypothetical protein
MQLTSAHPLQPAFLFVSLSSSPIFVPPIGQSLAAFPVTFMLGLGIGPGGGIDIPVPGITTPVAFDIYAQYVVSKMDGTYETSNAVKMSFPIN